MPHPRQNAVNVKIDVTLYDANDEVLDISDATTTNFIIRKPDGSVATWAAGFLTDGTDGALRYSVVDGDLDQAGRYKLQVQLTIPSEYDGLTDIGAFRVEENLE